MVDQGRPYAGEDYQRVLDVHGIVVSMSRRGNRCDAAMENWFWTVKSKLGERFDNVGVANC